MSAIFWADIDALDAANPGLFINQSLLVNVEGNTVASLSLPKGKKKRVVELDVQISENTAVISAFGVYARINNVPMEPPGFSDIQVLTSCDHSYPNCSITAYFWADLDALETANPGAFINQPLVIDVRGLSNSVAANVAVTARARMLKK